jgi:hypothetical protein
MVVQRGEERQADRPIQTDFYSEHLLGWKRVKLSKRARFPFLFIVFDSTNLLTSA